MDTRGTTYPGNPPGPIPERECREKESPTGKCITTTRQPYCVTLRTAKSNEEGAEHAYDRSVRLYYKKKELFEWTQHNYELYRDFDICVDSELTAITTALTANVKTYSALSQALYTNLKKVVAAVTDLKTKVSLLGDAAYNLDKYRNDQANASQWCLLTGKNVENCKPEPDHHHHRPEACHDADKVYDELILMTKKVLIPDVNSLMQSATDTVGIQTFTNIDGLTATQTNFGTATAALVTKVQATSKTRRTDLDTCQTDLATAVQNCTTAGVNKYGMISVAHGEHCTVQFLCCPDCDCVLPDRPDVLEPHLEKCECCICDIGEKIRSTYHHSEPGNWGENGGRHHPGDCGCGGHPTLPPIPQIR
jgi:hypothetical protein